MVQNPAHITGFPAARSDASAVQPEPVPGCHVALEASLWCSFLDRNLPMCRSRVMQSQNNFTTLASPDSSSTKNTMHLNMRYVRPLAMRLCVSWFLLAGAPHCTGSAASANRLATGFHYRTTGDSTASICSAITRSPVHPPSEWETNGAHPR